MPEYWKRTRNLTTRRLKQQIEKMVASPSSVQICTSPTHRTNFYHFLRHWNAPGLRQNIPWIEREWIFKKKRLQSKIKCFSWLSLRIRNRTLFWNTSVVIRMPEFQARRYFQQRRLHVTSNFLRQLWHLRFKVNVDRLWRKLNGGQNFDGYLAPVELHGSVVEKRAVPRHDHWNDRQIALFGQIETTLFEGEELALVWPRSFGKYPKFDLQNMKI